MSILCWQFRDFPVHCLCRLVASSSCRPHILWSLIHLSFCRCLLLHQEFVDRLHHQHCPGLGKPLLITFKNVDFTVLNASACKKSTISVALVNSYTLISYCCVGQTAVFCFPLSEFVRGSHHSPMEVSLLPTRIVLPFT